VLNISIRDLRGGDPAAICARRAINLIFHFLRDRLEASFHEIVPPEPSPESPVLVTLLFPVAFDLYEVC
jgi:hypothetical protein